MPVFQDDFERADGGLGNDWQWTGNAPSISSGVAVIPAYAMIYQDAYWGDGRQEVIATLDLQTDSDLSFLISLKYGAAYGDGYRFFGSGTLSSPIWHLHVVVNYSTTVDRSVGGSSLSTGPHTVRAVYDSGELRMYVDGAYITSVTHNGHDARTPLVMGSSGASATRLEAVMIAVDEDVTLSVSPSPIGNFGDPLELTFTGVGTDWTAGTPGSPTFTCNHGTLSDQTVASATSATATYDPGSYLGIVRFTDPSTGAYVDVQVSSDPILIPPGTSCLLDEDGADLLNTTAATYEGTLLTSDTPVVLVQEPYQDIDILTAISQIWHGFYSLYGFPGDPQGADVAINSIWRAINGGQIMPDDTYEQNNNIPVKQDLGYLITNIDELRGTPKATLAGILADITGVSARTITEVYDLVDALEAGSNQDVLDALAVYFGANPPTIEALGTMVSDIATIAGYTLGDVLDAIAAIPGADLSEITTKLDQIQPSTSYTLTTLDTDIATVDTVVDGIASSLDAIRTEGDLTLQDVIDAVNALAIPTGAHAPIWPGTSGVTLGAAVDLSDGLTITGPLHGLLFTISAAPPAAGKYLFGSVKSWQHVGGVIFQTDRGDYERAETFGLDAQLVVPRTMAVAAAAIVRLKAGFTGTVRKWSLTE